MPNIAVLGTGFWGKNLVRNFAALGTLRVVCDADADRLKTIAEQYAGVAATMSVADVLTDRTIDAVVIATPAATHVGLAREALLAGKDVFVEKPLALTAGDAASLVELAAEHSRILMVGHLLEYHPAVLKMLEFIRTGKLGKVQHLFSNRLNFGRFRSEENILWSFAPHDVSIFLMFMGEMPTVVHCNGAAFINPAIADITTCSFSFPSGVYGKIDVSWLHPFKEHRLAVIGSKGMLVFTDTDVDDKLKFYPHIVDWENGRVPVANPQRAEPIPFDPAEPLAEECAQFLRSVETRVPPRSDGNDGVRVLTVLQACQASLDRGGEPVLLASLQQAYWAHPTAEVHPEARVGAGSKIWHHSQVGKGAVIGQRCNVGHNCTVFGRAVVGNGVTLESNIDVWPLVTLEDDVFVGPSAVFTNDLTPRAFHKKGGVWVPTIIRRGASIGANATIVCGVTIGAYAAIGAGAVVTKDVPPHALMVGAPARRIAWICKCNKWVRLAFKDGNAACHECGLHYHIENDTVTVVE